MQEICQFCCSNTFNDIKYGGDMTAGVKQCSNCMFRMSIKVYDHNSECMICRENVFGDTSEKDTDDKKHQQIMAYENCHHWICFDCSERFKDGCYLCGKKNQKFVPITRSKLKINEHVKPFIQTLYIVIYDNPSFFAGINQDNKLSMHYETLALISEYFKFIKLLDEYGGAKFLSPSLIIDRVWHRHILDTRNYTDFCLNIIGKMIHHYPYNELNRENRKKRLQYTYECYEKKYWTKPPVKYWPPLEQNKFTTRLNEVPSVLSVPPDGAFQIFVKSINGYTRVVTVGPTLKILDIKKIIQHIDGIAPDDQSLIFSGRLLTNEKTVADYDIRKESTIHIVSNVRGC